MRRLLTTLALIILPVLAIVIGVNVWVDPGNILRKSDVENRIASILLTGKNAAVPRTFIDYNERLFQKSYISSVPKAADVMIFGSSRVRYVIKDLYKDQTFHNHAVNAATLEDFVALYWLYKQRGLAPKKLIISLDNWILDKDNGYTNWRIFWQDYAAGAKHAGLDAGILPDAIASGFWNSPKIKVWREAMSPAYFQESWRRILAGNFTRELYVESTDEMIAKGIIYIIAADGSFGDQGTQASVEEVRRLVQTVDDGVSPLKAIEPRLAQNLERFLDKLKADGVEVLLLLVPLHPYTFDKWTKGDAKGTLKAEQYFRDLAQKKSLKIVGSYDPAKIPAGEDEFRDWVHPRRPVLERILAGQ